MKNVKLFIAAGVLFLTGVIISVVSIFPVYDLADKQVSGTISEQALNAQLDRSEMLARVSTSVVFVAVVLFVVWAALAIRAAKSNAKKAEK